MDSRDALEELARSFDVHTAFRDSFGQEQCASPEALVAVLSCLGASIDHPDGAAEALSARQAAIARQRLAPFHVVWQGSAPRLFVGGELPPGGYRLRLLLCTGPSVEWSCPAERCRPGAAPDGRRQGHWLELDPPPGGDLPPELPLGQHSVELLEPGPVERAALVVAPLQAWVPDQQRQWGVFAPTYALRGPGGFGAGDLSHLRRVVEWVDTLGGQLVGTLPLLPLFLDELFEPSPYSPVSRLFWNEFYLDLEALPELSRCPAAQSLLSQTGATSGAQSLQARTQVDYAATARLKRPVLAALARAFFDAGGDQSDRYRRFLAQPRALDYARFRATVERRGEAFAKWPQLARSGQLRPGDYDEANCQYHLYCQFRMGEQMASLGARARQLGLGLYLDLPVGVHASGFDLWAEPEAFLLGCNAGAPPDVVFRGGQDWGLAPLSPAGLRQQAYRYFTDVIAHHLRCAGALRIDHVMGLQRIYCIPHGMDARQGVYVGYPLEELLAVLTLQSVQHQAALIGEDLGTVPPGLPEALERHRIRRMHVVECALDGGTLYWGSLTPSAVASLNTHDIVPFAAWCEGADIEQRLVAGESKEEAANHERGRRRHVVAQLGWQLAEEGHLSREAAEHLQAWSERAEAGVNEPASSAPWAALLAALYARLGRSDAPLVVANLEDLWLERTPQNTPGTDSSCSNWKHRARHAVEELGPDSPARQLLSGLAAARRSAPEGDPR